MGNSPLTMEPFGLPSDGGGKDLGVFMPIANGGWILSKNAPRLDGSYEYNRKVAKLADEIGLDFIMSMAKYRGYGGETEHWRYTLDATACMSALAEATSRVKVWTTVHTILQNPAVTAKMIATLDQISHGRSGLNVVTGAYKGEFSQMGAWPEGVDHDARYDLATEWIRAIKALWTEDSVTMKGEYFQLDDCMSDPKPSTKPFLVCAGTSKRGMEFTSQEMDAIFLSGGNAKELARASRESKDVAATYGRNIRTYSMMTLLFAESDEAAEREAAHYRAGLDEGALRGMMKAYGFLDAEIGKENSFVEKSRSTFQTPHLMGTARGVTERLCDMLEESQIDGLMLIFPDYLAGMPIFGAEVLPALRERFPSVRREPAHV
jgi:pyrimidine oxygenase